jgi:hypothetical protein
MPGNQHRDWRFSLINMAGQKIAEGAVMFLSGADEASIHVPATLSHGFYSLQLSGSEGAFALPLIIE